MGPRGCFDWRGCALMLVVNGTAVASPPVTFDGTLGPKGSLSGPNLIIPAGRGRTVGSNLFHSFGRFDIPSGSTARFQGPAQVANVVARVTSGATSHIDGSLVCEIPSANFFMVNPAGVLFGP